MKILFVCWANVGRSQMAASFYNHLTGTQDADSAGTEVEMPGESIGERRTRRGGTYVIDSMNQLGLDVSGNLKTQLTPEMLDTYDHVISMADLQYTPDWLKNHPKYEFWDIADPGGKDLQAVNVARDSIKAKVSQLTFREKVSPQDKL